MSKLLWASMVLIASAAIPMSAKAGEQNSCAAAISTVELSRCISTALQRKDAELLAGFQRLAAQVAEVPSPVFNTLWRDNLTGFFQTSADPKIQLGRFQAERKKVCAYAKSMAFQGTGYGIFVRQCELALSDALLQQLEP